MGDSIERRRFLAGAGALVPAGLLAMERSAGAEPTTLRNQGRAARVALPMALPSDVVNQVQLAETESFANSRQEGGKTVIAGTFTPSDTDVVVDIDVSTTFGGWGGGYFDFHIGVLPATPPTPWEPGGKNRIVKANNSSRTPLDGVTEYQHFPVGVANANTIGAQIARKVVLEGLTPDQEYQWELRCGGMSFYKEYTFETGAQPKYLTPTGDGLYAWVTCDGNDRLALLELGWAELWGHLGYVQEMLCVAEIQLAGTPGGIALQPGGDLLAVVDETNNKLVIVNGATLSIVGSYNAPAGVTLTQLRCVFNSAGTKLYVGGWSDGKLHRWDVASSAWDQNVTIDAGGTIILLDLTADGRYLWASSFFNRKVYRIDLQPGTPSSTLVYTTPAGSFAPSAGAVRNSDGSIVFTDPVNNLVRHVSSAGSLLNTWSSTVAGQGTQNAHSSVQLDEEEVRAFWTDDGVIGWAWIDSAQVINSTHGLFSDSVYGDVGVTGNEGTLVALPTSNKVAHWPGGHVYIRPSKDDPGVFGAEHAHVTFTGAEATGG